MLLKVNTNYEIRQNLLFERFMLFWFWMRPLKYFNSILTTDANCDKILRQVKCFGRGVNAFAAARRDTAVGVSRST